MSNSLWPYGLLPTRLHGDSPGRNTGVGEDPFSRGSSRSRDQTWVSCMAGGFFTVWTTREAPNSSLWLFNSLLRVLEYRNLWFRERTEFGAETYDQTLVPCRVSGVCYCKNKPAVNFLLGNKQQTLWKQKFCTFHPIILKQRAFAKSKKIQQNHSKEKLSASTSTKSV